MIETVDLRKTYEGGIEALKGINLKLEKRFSAIIGKNGAGKTTLVRILSTQLEPTSGKAYINGLDVMKDAKKIRRIIVSIPQEASPIGILTPLELVKLYLIARGVSFHDSHIIAKRALEEVGLDEFANVPTDMLSGGMKRKVFVAMGLASNAEIIFLDEPTTGLDPISRFEVWSSIRKLDGRIVLTTHYMEEAANLAEDIVMVDSGKVLEKGNVKDLLERFRGKVRVESYKPLEESYKIGDLYIKYVDEKYASEYFSEGFAIRKVTLDDLFIVHGVEYER